MFCIVGFLLALVSHSDKLLMNSKLSHYRKVREITMELNSKIIETATKDDFKITLRTLGLLKGDKFIIDDEENIDRCYDFLIHDYHNIDGESLTQKFYKNNSVTDEESMILEAVIGSDCSLYRVIKADPESYQIELLDLLNQGQKLFVFDLGFSSNPMIEGFIVYSRIVRFEEFNTTSGAALLFEGENEDVILQKYPKMLKKERVGDEKSKRSAVFFKLFQKLGFHKMLYI